MSRAWTAPYTHLCSQGFRSFGFGFGRRRAACQCSCGSRGELLLSPRAALKTCCLISSSYCNHDDCFRTLDYVLALPATEYRADCLDCMTAHLLPMLLLPLHLCHCFARCYCCSCFYVHNDFACRILSQQVPQACAGVFHRYRDVGSPQPTILLLLLLFPL